MHNNEMQANTKYNHFQEIERQRREQARMNKLSALDKGLPSIALPILGAYLWAGHSINKMQKGEDPGSIGTFVAKYPLMAGLTGAALVNTSSRNAIFSALKHTKTANDNNIEKDALAKSKLLWPALSIAAPIVGSHVIAARTINKAQQGQPYSKAEAFITKHPLAAGAAGSVLLTPTLRNAVKEWGRYMIKGAEDQMQGLEQLTPMDQDKLLCAYWEYVPGK